MKILLVHNRYKQLGGEDTVFDAESQLLSSAGHQIERFEVTNDTISGTYSQINTAIGTVYNSRSKQLVSAAINRFQPDIVHVHNFFPLLSPSIFDACSDAKVPSVLTLHNYRITCLNGILLRDDVPCEACVGRLPLPGVVNKCYKGSLAGSIAVAAMMEVHKRRRTWFHKVNRFIALTNFARDIFIRAGLPAEKISIKPNFSNSSVEKVLPAHSRSGFVFVGRLSSEKGLDTLLEAWRNLGLDLTIIGKGPLEEKVIAAASESRYIHYIGAQPTERVLSEISRAKAIIVPSIWYENFPMTVVEAYSRGTPVIASNLGALQAIVHDQREGLLFNSASSSDLRDHVLTVENFSNDLLDRFISNAHQAYFRDLTPNSALRDLRHIYDKAINS